MEDRKRFEYVDKKADEIYEIIKKEELKEYEFKALMCFLAKAYSDDNDINLRYMFIDMLGAIHDAEKKVEFIKNFIERIKNE